MEKIAKISDVRMLEIFNSISECHSQENSPKFLYETSKNNPNARKDLIRGNISKVAHLDIDHGGEFTDDGELEVRQSKMLETLCNGF